MVTKTKRSLTGALLSSLTLLSILMGSSVLAAEPNKAAEPSKKIDLKKVKAEQGAQIQVVQNRAFTKVERLQLSVNWGSVMTDPFLSVYTLGGKIGYNFSDMFSMQVVAWKDFASVSSSERKFEDVNHGQATNSNAPKSLYAVEGLFSPIYGKLNFMNESILYYDFHVGAGLGIRKTASGSSPAYIITAGQDIFLSQHLVLELEYRALMFNQDIIEKYGTPTSPLGSVIAKSFEISNVFTVGLGFLL